MWVLLLGAMLLAASAQAQEMPARVQDVPEPAVENEPVAPIGEEEGAPAGEQHAAPEQDGALNLLPAIQGIEAAIRDLVPEENAIEREAERRRNEADLRAQQDMARWAFWTMLAAGASVFLAFVGVCLIWRTLHYTRDAAIYAKKAAEAAEASVNVTKDIGQRQLRAYVSVTSVEAVVKPVGGLIDFSVLVTFKNFGQTPAGLQEVRIDIDAKTWHGRACKISEFRREIGPSVEISTRLHVRVEMDEFLWGSIYGSKFGTLDAIIRFFYLDYLDRERRHHIAYRGDVVIDDAETWGPLKVSLEPLSILPLEGNREAPTAGSAS